MLFNLIMISLANKLEVENITRTIYADDITIWSVCGNDGQIETALQEAINTVEEHLADTRLRCSPKLLLYRPTLKGRPLKGCAREREYDQIKLGTNNGGTIPIVDHIRVLGMLIKNMGLTDRPLKDMHKTTNAVRLLKRVTHKRSGMREDSLIRLIHYFVMCHIVYVAAMHNWYRCERNKINIIIRRLYKIAHGLPESTSTEKLLQLGLHNTLNEVAEAQRISTSKGSPPLAQEDTFCKR